MLDKLRELTGGNDERMTIYATMFIEEISQYLPKMDAALQIKNYNNLKVLIHTSKSLLQTMGFTGALQHANILEELIIENNDFNVIESKYLLFRQTLNNCTAEVALLLKTLGRINRPKSG